MGVTRPRFLWFLVAVSPCVFAAFMAVLLLIPMGPRPAPFIVLHAIAALSALGGLVLVRYRFAFLRRPPRRQRLYAAAVWGIHVLAFLAWFATVLILSGGP